MDSRNAAEEHRRQRIEAFKEFVGIAYLQAWCNESMVEDPGNCIYPELAAWLDHEEAELDLEAGVIPSAQ